MNAIGSFERYLCKRFERYDIIGGSGELYLRRWLIRRWSSGYKLYLHKIYTRDQDRHLHDHPWNALVIVLGPLGYLEELFPDNEPFADVDDALTLSSEKLAFKIAKTFFRARLPLEARILRGETWHRVKLYRNQFQPDSPEIPCWSLCLVTPKHRRWGFLTEFGKADAEDYFENYEAYNPSLPTPPHNQ